MSKKTKNWGWEPEEPTEDVKVWRYLSFTKFVSLIDSNRIHFARADSFADPFEGSLPVKFAEKRRENFSKMNIHDDTFSEMGKKEREYAEISCWHESNFESDAMWKLYGSDENALAVVSTVSQLKSSLEPFYREGSPMAMPGPVTGRVQYLDLLSEESGEHLKNPLGRFFTKDKSFEHEKEIRIVRFFYPPHYSGYKDSLPRPEGGSQIECNINTLIERIVVSPRAQQWFYQLVESVVKQYSLDFDVEYSTLRRDPDF